MLSGQLGNGVDAAWARSVGLGIRRVAVTRKDVVGAQVHEPRAGVCAALRETLDSSCVHLERAVFLALADLDVVKRGTVEDDCRLDPFECLLQRPLVGDVEFAAAGRGHQAAVAELLLEIRAKLTSAAGDQDAVSVDLHLVRSGAGSSRRPVHRCSVRAMRTE